MTRLSLFRRSLLAIVAMGAVLPFIVWAANASIKGMFNSPFLWVPLGNEKRDEFWWFVESFNAQDTVIVSWPGCTVDDERLARLESALLSDAPADENTKRSELFERVDTGYSAIRELQEEPLNLSRTASLQRLRGTLVGKDGETSCAVIVMTLKGVIDRELSVETLLRIAKTELHIERDQCYLGGLLVTGLAIDRESTRALDYFAIPSVVLVVVLCWFCLRSWRLMLPIVLVAAFGERLVMSTVHLCGSNMNAVLIVMSPFVFVLTVSAGIHLANYYADEVRLRGSAGAATRSLAVALVPCSLAAVTTTIGLLSLLISDIVPVREFGGYSSLCMLVAVVLLFLVFPGIMDKWPVAVGNDLRDNRDEKWTSGGFDVFGAVSRLVCHHSIWVVLASLCLMGVSCWGLTRVRTTIDVLELLSSETRTIRDHQWLETNVASLASLEIIIHFDGDCPLDLVERMEVLRDVEREIATIQSIGGTMSALTFVPPIPRPGGVPGTVRRTVFKTRVQGESPHLVELGYLHESDTRQSWRITARAPALGDLDYRLLIDDLAAKVNPTVRRYGGGSQSAISATYTGTMPIVVDAQQVLLRELIVSYMTAFAIIAVVIILAVRSVPAGLVAMIPNLFPTVVLFGTMGWLNRPLDIGSMMTASVALGIAVDDTLHLLLWYRRELSAGKTAQAAVTSALRHCGKAMTHTTLICGCGMLVFTLSDFEPIRQFALMMFLLLAAALVGDLFLLPALLVGPCRRVFQRGVVAHHKQLAE